MSLLNHSIKILQAVLDNRLKLKLKDKCKINCVNSNNTTQLGSMDDKDIKKQK